MLTARYYQTAAIDAIMAYWTEEPGNPLVEMATGVGKSYVMAGLIERLITGWPDMRIVVATHVAELIEQDFLELLRLWPAAPAGIYSAGLGRRDYRARILFAGIQTVHNKVGQIGFVDVLMVDEAHLIPKSANTMYGRFIAALREINPDLKIVGLTATPYRLDSGRLDEGDDRLFDKVVYTYGIGDGIRDGYLCPLSSKPTGVGFDLAGVGRQAGDYKQNALQAAVDKADVTRAAVEEIIAKGQDRRSWLCFCSGVEHAEHVRDALIERGISAAMISGDTPKEERRQIIADFKAYRIRALTNNSVLTTGFNHQGVDLIAFLRPTLSAGLYLQMAGRGTRVLYAPGADLSTDEGRLAAIAAGPKPNCLVLDFAGLVRRHGPVDMVEPKKPGKGDGEAPVKQCPDCEELVHASIRICPCCGFEFPIDDTPKIAPKADITPILSNAEVDWYPVTSQTFRRHVSRDVNKADSVRVDFVVGMAVYKSWLPVEHPKAKFLADRFWARHGGKRPFPSTVEEFLDRVGDLKATAQVQIKFGGKFPEIKDYRPSESGVVVDLPTPANDNDAGSAERARLRALMEDDIPF